MPTSLRNGKLCGTTVQILHGGMIRHSSLTGHHIKLGNNKQSSADENSRYGMTAADFGIPATVQSQGLKHHLQRIGISTVGRPFVEPRLNQVSSGIGHTSHGMMAVGGPLFPGDSPGKESQAPITDYHQHIMSANDSCYQDLDRVSSECGRTRHGMMAVNPGFTARFPEAEKVSAPQTKEARVRRKMQSGLMEPRKWRAT